MNGAFTSATSRFAVAAALGLVLSVGSAQAADLGGNCCADLEERVAELEATTARKGNRKMSLTITGQVHRMIMWWDDGQSSKTYWGIENRNSSSRFSILGEAKVTANVKMGFEIMLDNQAASSAGINQWDSDGKNNARITPVGGVPFTGNNADNYFGAARRIAFWIEDAKLGRMTVGHYEMAGAITTIDLGGISAGASASMELVNGGFLIRGPAGQYYTMSWSTITDAAANQARQNEVRWDSPTVMGFILSSSIANDGSNWGTMLRYANEFGGYRVAAGIGWEHYGQVSAGQTCINVSTTSTTSCTFATGDGGPGNGYGPVDLNNPVPDINAWGVGASVLHVPTGLFVQGHYIYSDFSENKATTIAPANFWGAAKTGLITADQWLIQGGITKNWLGFGNTALFGEYSRSTGWGAAGGPLAPAGASYSNATLPGATAVNGVIDSELTVYGFGIAQNVDAAATELYLDWRHFSADVTCSSTGFNCSGSAATIGTVGLQKLQTEDFWVVIGGARMKF
jgi:hypothetical protein